MQGNLNFAGDFMKIDMGQGQFRQNKESFCIRKTMPIL